MVQPKKIRNFIRIVRNIQKEGTNKMYFQDFNLLENIFYLSLLHFTPFLLRGLFLTICNQRFKMAKNTNYFLLKCEITHLMFSCINFLQLSNNIGINAVKSRRLSAINS